MYEFQLDGDGSISILFIIIIHLLIIPNKVTTRIEFSDWLFKNYSIYFNIKVEMKNYCIYFNIKVEKR